jgi:hypothetical protein
MHNHQISITDVTWSIYGTARASPSSLTPQSPTATRTVPPRKQAVAEISGLGTPQPIPDLEQLINIALCQLKPIKKNTLTNVGTGVLCAVEDVRQVTRALHHQVHQRLSP